MARFERYARLELYTGSAVGGSTIYKSYDFSSSYDSMNLKFNVEIPNGVDESNKATISVCGMTKDTISEISSYLMPEAQQTHYLSARLFAGYKDEKSLRQIFAGQVTLAKPTQPPDVWLEMECITGYDQTHEMVCKYRSFPSGIKDLYQLGATWMGLSLDWQVKDGNNNALSKENFAYNKSIWFFPAYMARLFPSVVGYVDATGKKLIVVDRDNPEIGAGAIQVSQNQNMIGIPEPSGLGVTVNVFLDTRIERNLKIILASETWPKANGIYKVFSYKHIGELRGGEWKTELTCTPIVRWRG